MKKILFFISSLISLYLIASCIAVAIEVSKQITNFGLGVLTGKLILLILFTALSIWLGRKIFNKQSKF